MNPSRYITPSLRSLFHQRCSIGPLGHVPVVVVVEVPVVWEVVPGGGFVAVASGSACLLILVGFGLVFQDLGDGSAVGFGGDEDLRKDQRARGSSALLTLVLPDSPRLGSG